MLVLTRKEGELLRIGDDIIVEVLAIDKGRVRIGIVAPRDIRVVRGELLLMDKQQQIQVEKDGEQL